MTDYKKLFYDCKLESSDAVFEHWSEFMEHVPELLLPYFEEYVERRLQNKEPLSRCSTYFSLFLQEDSKRIYLMCLLLEFDKKGLLKSTDERYYKSLRGALYYGN